jgi:glutamate synthase (NADPH/NADH) large chain
MWDKSLEDTIKTDEHDACGVGFITSLTGQPTREVVEKAVEALANLSHRGAVGADGKTGDGAGIHLEIPFQFFKEQIEATGRTLESGLLAVGMVFLPRRTLDEQEQCRTIVESEAAKRGLIVYGWRRVPIDIAVIGEKAADVRPEIEQILLLKPYPEEESREARNLAKTAFEAELYVLRRIIEKQVEAASIKDFYVCSLSSRSIIYKGMFLADQITAFYPDLADSRFVSRFAIFHQRYSTNTFPTWKLAHPFRVIAHNGEINTLKGNMAWMQGHEVRLESPVFGAEIEALKPIIQRGLSDSAALDNVMELLVRAGRPLALAKALLIPEAWHRNDPTMPDALKALYSYSNSVVEPWDGPAAVVATDGQCVQVGMDRNGLRPFRYTQTKTLLIGASETGVVDLEETDILHKGRLGPGQLFSVDLETGAVLNDKAVKQWLVEHLPCEKWAENIVLFEDILKEAGGERREAEEFSTDTLLRRQCAVGWSLEETELVLHPMAETGKEAVGSMGDDTPLAVLSQQYRGLHHFFRQNFAQVTNPPIDPLREHYVMSLATRMGNLENMLYTAQHHAPILELSSPILLSHEFAALKQYVGRSVVKDWTPVFAGDSLGTDTIKEISPAKGVQTVSGIESPAKAGIQSSVALLSCVFLRTTTLENALQTLQQQAEAAVHSGVKLLILSDKAVDSAHIGIPMILATSAVHSYLLNKGLRTFISLAVEAGDCLDTHQAAVLIGVGATVVVPYLAEATLQHRHAKGLYPKQSLEKTLNNYKAALEQGLLKIISKLGIAAISSYRGGYNFEVLGLSRAVTSAYFSGVTSRISGISLAEIEQRLINVHDQAFGSDAIPLSVGGFYRYRNGGEHHAHAPETTHLLQEAVGKNSYALYKKYSAKIHNAPPVHIRDLLDFTHDAPPVKLEDVQSITEIRKVFVTPGMSLGALSPEAHGTLNIAMNRMGARSDSGEGGEDKARYTLLPNGDNANSRIKQVASGRFGVTAEYLNQCDEIEIKVAQGAKPGEGGQLPSFKVTAEIAALRHAKQGMTLISPPPHHDIYSIEDLAQLIYDLKQINATARICVKLVAKSGIGTIATGVAKAGADVILIAGHNGGTGASPLSSVKYAGVSWELGLSEVHQALVINNLRHKITLRTDGGLKTGRDIVIAALLGAEEFGIGTASLVAMGCILVRQCHSNTCPVGICTQDTALREKFSGSPEKVINLFSFIAEEVREILSSLGLKSLHDACGRSDRLYQIYKQNSVFNQIDLNAVLARPESSAVEYTTKIYRNPVPDTLDALLIKDAEPFLNEGAKMQLTYVVQNTHRTVGARLSGEVTRRYGMQHFADDQLTIRLRGSAGQSLGAFLCKGITLEVHGEANDYVGKGLSGGCIIVRPRAASTLLSSDNAIIGNTVLYGATAGTLFAAGLAGERFAVRNSGATAVIEGCGANGCEYMTGGTVAILGAVGHNFAAGMTGGEVFVYDPHQKLSQYINEESVVAMALNKDSADRLKVLLEQYGARTDSAVAAQLLSRWTQTVQHFAWVRGKEQVVQAGQKREIKKL